MPAVFRERNKLGLTLVGNGDCVMVPGSWLWAKASSSLSFLQQMTLRLSSSRLSEDADGSVIYLLSIQLTVNIG